MKGARRLFSALLALALVCGAARFPADAADSGYEIAVLTAQTLTAGTTFNPDTAPDAESVKAGDIVVLTLGFRNGSGAAVDVAGFAVKLLYDKEKVAPYTGTSPFARNPYQCNPELSGDYGWSQAGNGDGDGFVAVSGGGSDAYAVASGETLFLCRMAFQAKADGAAEFKLDADKTKTNVINANRKPLTLGAFQPFNLTIDEGGSVPDNPAGPDTPDNPAGPDTPDNPANPDAPQGFSLQVAKAQTLTAGTAFDPDTAPDAGNVHAGDIVVLTLGFYNNSGAAVDVAGFAVKLLYDETKVAPYTGTAPFARNAYQVSTDLTVDYGWSQAGNANEDSFVSASAGGSEAYSVKSGETLFLCRMAFQVNADAFDGAAAFTLDPDAAKTNVIDAKRQSLTLNALQAFRLTIGEGGAPVTYWIDAFEANKSAGTLTVALTNPEAVTVAVAFFNADKRCVSVGMADAPAQCGRVALPLADASTAKVMLLDSDWKPLCASLEANIA